MAGPVVNIDEAEGFPTGPRGGSETFGAYVQRLGPMVGLTRLGCMVTTVEPGRRAFPFHNHHANDEMFVVLAGTGEVRIGEGRHPIREGDVIGCPAGGPETAHQIINTGDTPLKYLAISSMQDPEIVEYPDSGKMAAIAIGEGRTFLDARLREVHVQAAKVDYWEGEKT